MKFDFDHGVNRKGTYSMKYDDPAYFRRLVPGIRLDEGTIRLMLADMDFPCAPAITRALHRVADFGTFGYTTADAAPEYNAAIRSWYQRRYGLTLEPDHILPCSGALEGVPKESGLFPSPVTG